VLLAALYAGCARPPPPESLDDGGRKTAADGASAMGTARAPIGTGGTAKGMFPFPQNRQTRHCAELDVETSVTQEAWDKWKAQAVVTEGAGGFVRVRRWDEQDDTVSEGIAYGMLAAVYMNDQATFDGLYAYSQLHLDRNGFMHWRVDAAGDEVDGAGKPLDMAARGGATDADEDIAWALLMAHYQWGGRGALDADYSELARTMIELIWRFEVDHAGGEVLKPGDNWGGASVTNPSYFMPSYYRVFGKVTGREADWNKVVDSSYDILDASAHAETGLVPAWCKSDGKSAGREYFYQYDACRTPFRIAVDYCDNGDPRAKAYLEKTSAFFVREGAAGIRGGYDLDGTARATWPSAAFTGPAAVGSLVSDELSGFTSDAYTELLVMGNQGPEQGYSYYNASWHLLSMLMLSGNFVDYSSL
jgi:endo-1,4-beta-D-glucanase Y